MLGTSINQFIIPMSNINKTASPLSLYCRHCLWILGNATTLLNSESVLKKLVIDAKNRGCFYNALEDKCLAKTLLYSLIELNAVNDLDNVLSSLFNDARWKVCLDFYLPYIFIHPFMLCQIS